MKIVFKKTLLFSLAIFFIFSGASCIGISVGQGQTGIFKSIDQGDHWVKKTSLYSLKQNSSLAGVEGTILSVDPQDSATLYLGTKANGLYVSFDKGETWRQLDRLPIGIIHDISIHPTASHILYVAVGNKVVRTDDFGRFFKTVYSEVKSGLEVINVKVDLSSPNIIYASLSDGRLLKSEDSGFSWNILNDFQNSIRQILINPKNPNIFYVFTTSNNVWRSEDKGRAWTLLNDNLKDYAGATNVKKAVFMPAYNDALILANGYGLNLTLDGGKTWSAYQLLTSPGKVAVDSVATDTHNGNIIYYLANKVLYKTIDGGMNWTTRSLPSQEKPSNIYVDAENANIIYLIYQKDAQQSLF